jgi:H+/Cl- antiporter ClcA
VRCVTSAVFVTSMAAGSGLVGGVFAPSLFIGAAVGSSIGTAAQTMGLGPEGGWGSIQFKRFQ